MKERREDWCGTRYKGGQLSIAIPLRFELHVQVVEGPMCVLLYVYQKETCVYVVVFMLRGLGDHMAHMCHWVLVLFCLLK